MVGRVRMFRHSPGGLRNAAIHPGRHFPRSFFSNVLLWRARMTRLRVVKVPLLSPSSTLIQTPYSSIYNYRVA